MTQAPLQFENRAPIAASADPWTSKAAGRQLTKSGRRDSQKGMVLECLRKYPLGVTSAELALFESLNRYLVARRLPDLERDGYVQRLEAARCTVSGKFAVCWRVRRHE
jgi:hypothetical protein